MVQKDGRRAAEEAVTDMWRRKRKRPQGDDTLAEPDRKTGNGAMQAIYFLDLRRRHCLGEPIRERTLPLNCMLDDVLLPRPQFDNLRLKLIPGHRARHRLT